MVAKDLINSNIPVLKPSDSVDKALQIMADMHITELPLINNELRFLGLYSEDLLLNYGYDTVLEDIQPMFETAYVLEHQPILEIIKTFKSNSALDLAVLNSNFEYLGIVEKLEVYNQFVNQFDIFGNGGMIEIKFQNREFSIAEIARLIENENTKISYLYQTEEVGLVENFTILTLKLNNPNISNIVNTLNRHGYDVVSYFSTEPVTNLEKDRYDLLMKYLSI